VFPAAIDAVVGVTAIETSTAGVTVSVTPEEVTPLCDAVMIAAPDATPMATPEELIVAVAGLDEFHATPVVNT